MLRRRDGRRVAGPWTRGDGVRAAWRTRGSKRRAVGALRAAGLGAYVLRAGCARQPTASTRLVGCARVSARASCGGGTRGGELRCVDQPLRRAVRGGRRDVEDPAAGRVALGRRGARQADALGAASGGVLELTPLVRARRASGRARARRRGRSDGGDGVAGGSARGTSALGPRGEDRALRGTPGCRQRAGRVARGSPGGVVVGDHCRRGRTGGTAKRAFRGARQRARARRAAGWLRRAGDPQSAPGIGSYGGLAGDRAGGFALGDPDRRFAGRWIGSTSRDTRGVRRPPSVAAGVGPSRRPAARASWRLDLAHHRHPNGAPAPPRQLNDPVPSWR